MVRNLKAPLIVCYAAAIMVVVTSCSLPAILDSTLGTSGRQSKAERVQALVDAAERALAEDRLLTPEDDCAYFYYTMAQSLAPRRPDIVEGLEQIVERYLSLARSAISKKGWGTASTMLDRATTVNASHPGIAPLRRQVDLLSKARSLTLELAEEEVRQRQPEAAVKLADFGTQARRSNARVTIRAANDEDGRWIYVQLNGAPGEARIRAEIEIGTPPMVTILLLPPDAG